MEPDGGSDASAQADRRRTLERRRNALLLAQTSLLRSVVDFHEPAGLGAGLMALCDGIRSRFGCERVVIGLHDGDATSVAAISQQAVVDDGAPETRLLGEAMHEACGCGASVRYPVDATPAGRGAAGSYPAHRALVEGRPHANIFSVPMYRRGRPIGALLLERGSESPWDEGRFQSLEHLAATLAPMIDDRRAAGRTLGRHALDDLRDAAQWTGAPRHLVAKVGAAAALCLLLALALVPIEHRIAADAELVPVRSRTVTAPVDGYIAEVAVAAGDAVREGQVLFELDSRDLALERDGRRGEIARIEAEARAARAAGERKRSAVLKARDDQARAELALAEQRIARSTVVAPHAGLVLSADLERLVGAPVERGQRLVEIAPDGDWTVILLVDERDIDLVAPEQRGTLALQARPDERMALAIDAVHPIAVTDAAGTRFRVDATVEQAPAGLLPGQTGVAKVRVGRTSALRLLTTRFVDWLDMLRWEWFG